MGLQDQIQVRWFFYIEVQTACSKFLISKKARLVAQGYEKEYGPYYAETSRSVQLLKMVPFAPAYIQHWPNSHPS